LAKDAILPLQQSVAAPRHSTRMHGWRLSPADFRREADDILASILLT
jgi:hypothetical protein